MFSSLFSLESRFAFFLFSQRRNYIPILSIYFLTLWDTNAAQIWVFVWLGYLASFLLEVPSAYFADNFWHKKTLVISKIFQALSLILFIGASVLDSPLNYYIFILWSITQAIGFSFFSGTTSAYFHEILETENRWKEFWNIISKLRWKVSLVCAWVIVALPFLTALDIRLPLLINLIIDILWLLILFTLPSPKNKYEVKKSKNIFEIISEAKTSKALHISIFLWLIVWFLMWENAYRTVYLESLGYPIIYIWFVMWLSRIVWFIVWHYAYILEKLFTLRQLFLFELILFPFFLIIIAYFNNPYLVWILLSIIIWYQHGRKWILQWFILNDYLQDKRYKATVLSIESWVNSLISMIVAFWSGFIMLYSYKLWYVVLSLTLFIMLVINFYYIFRDKK